MRKRSRVWLVALKIKGTEDADSWGEGRGGAEVALFNLRVFIDKITLT